MFNRRAFSLWLIFYCLFSSAGIKTAFSQDAFSDLETSALYSSEPDIINGTKWYYQNKYKGHPFWLDDALLEGAVVFNGKTFTGLALKYELVDDELILSKKIDGNTRILKLNEKLVESFTLNEPGTNNSHLFKKTQLPGIKGVRYYHAVYQGQSACYIHHRKKIRNRVTGDYLGSYLYQAAIYVKADQEFVECRNKKALFNIFEDKKKLLRKYMRRNNLKVDGKKPEDMARILNYYDSLNQ